ncbi:MAG: family 43 glycosylhydrolase [Eubacteriales bacterium]|nr:family 43 glycosylhydrolase [Eubacteriales bacterium]
MRLVAPEGLTNQERIDWYNVEENTSHYLYGTRGGWEKYSENPVVGMPKWIGTCFDMSVVKRENLYHMWFSWRPHRGIGYTTSLDGLQWEPPQLVMGPVEHSSFEGDEINRPSVLWRDGWFHMWYSGQMRPYVEGGVSTICYARSRDGVHWERPVPQPVLLPDQPWELTAIMCPHVLFDDEDQQYKMWYSGGSNHEPDAIGYAWSNDGFVWHKHNGPVLEKEPSNEWEQLKVVGPHVVKYNGWFYMFYIGHMHEERGSIGLCRSRNGIDGWERHPENPLIAPEKAGFDDVSVYKPFVLKESQGWSMWYNGATFDNDVWVYETIGYARHQEENLF